MKFPELYERTSPLFNEEPPVKMTVSVVGTDELSQFIPIRDKDTGEVLLKSDGKPITRKKVIGVTVLLNDGTEVRHTFPQPRFRVVVCGQEQNEIYDDESDKDVMGNPRRKRRKFFRTYDEALEYGKKNVRVPFHVERFLKQGDTYTVVSSGGRKSESMSLAKLARKYSSQLVGQVLYAIESHSSS